MTISERNTLNRWELMAQKDLGCNVQPVAQELFKFFGEMVNCGYGQISGEEYSTIKPLLRGFAITHENQFYDACNVVETLDLDVIDMCKDAVEDFEDWLMNEKGWMDKYSYARAI